MIFQHARKYFLRGINKQVQLPNTWPYERGITEWQDGYEVAKKASCHLDSARVRIRLGFRVMVRFVVLGLSM